MTFENAPLTGKTATIEFLKALAIDGSRPITIISGQADNYMAIAHPEHGLSITHRFTKYVKATNKPVKRHQHTELSSDETEWRLIDNAIADGHAFLNNLSTTRGNAVHYKANYLQDGLGNDAFQYSTDLFFEDDERTLAAQEERIKQAERKLGIKFTVVSSGSKSLHAHLRTREKLDKVTWTRIMQLLAIYMDSDFAVCTPHRQMKMAGFDRVLKDGSIGHQSLLQTGLPCTPSILESSIRTDLGIVHFNEQRFKLYKRLVMAQRQNKQFVSEDATIDREHRNQFQRAPRQFLTHAPDLLDCFRLKDSELFKAPVIYSKPQTNDNGIYTNTLTRWFKEEIEPALYSLDLATQYSLGHDYNYSFKTEQGILKGNSPHSSTNSSGTTFRIFPKGNWFCHALNEGGNLKKHLLLMWYGKESVSGREFYDFCCELARHLGLVKPDYMDQKLSPAKKLEKAIQEAVSIHQSSIDSDDVSIDEPSADDALLSLQQVAFRKITADYERAHKRPDIVLPELEDNDLHISLGNTPTYPEWLAMGSPQLFVDGADKDASIVLAVCEELMDQGFHHFDFNGETGSGKSHFSGHTMTKKRETFKREYIGVEGDALQEKVDEFRTVYVTSAPQNGATLEIEKHPHTPSASPMREKAGMVQESGQPYLVTAQTDDTNYAALCPEFDNIQEIRSRGGEVHRGLDSEFCKNGCSKFKGNLHSCPYIQEMNKSKQEPVIRTHIEKPLGGGHLAIVDEAGSIISHSDKVSITNAAREQEAYQALNGKLTYDEDMNPHFDKNPLAQFKPVIEAVDNIYKKLAHITTGEGKSRNEHHYGLSCQDLDNVVDRRFWPNEDEKVEFTSFRQTTNRRDYTPDLINAEKNASRSFGIKAHLESLLPAGNVEMALFSRHKHYLSDLNNSIRHLIAQIKPQLVSFLDRQLKTATDTYRQKLKAFKKDVSEIEARKPGQGKNLSIEPALKQYWELLWPDSDERQSVSFSEICQFIISPSRIAKTIQLVGFVPSKFDTGALVRPHSLAYTRQLCEKELQHTTSQVIEGKTSHTAKSEAIKSSMMPGAISRLMHYIDAPRGSNVPEMEMVHGVAAFTYASNRHVNNLKKFTNVITMDATASIETIARIHDCRPAEVARIRWTKPSHKSLTINVLLGTGTMGSDRRSGGDHTAAERPNKIAEALIKKYYDDSFGILDLKKHLGEYSDFVKSNAIIGNQFGDSRGSNSFKQVDRLLLVRSNGRMNMTSQHVDYTIAHRTQFGFNRSALADDKGFMQWTDLYSKENLVQSVGRLRSQHREDEAMNAYHVGNLSDSDIQRLSEAFPGATIKFIAAGDIVADGAERGHETARSLLAAVFDAATKGEDVSNRKLAALIGRSASTVSRVANGICDGGVQALTKVIRFARESIYNKADRLSDETWTVLDVLREYIPERVNQLMAMEDPKERAKEYVSIFENLGHQAFLASIGDWRQQDLHALFEDLDFAREVTRLNPELAAVSIPIALALA